MDANYFREKAETCRRLANGLRWSNPDRFHLMDLVEDFQKRAELAQQRAQDDPEKRSSLNVRTQSVRTAQGRLRW
jgi:hypothetical protein